MKSVKEAAERIEEVYQEGKQHYARIDEVEDRVLKAIAATRWTPVLVLVGVVVGFILARWV